MFKMSNEMQIFLNNVNFVIDGLLMYLFQDVLNNLQFVFDLAGINGNFDCFAKFLIGSG